MFAFEKLPAKIFFETKSPKKLLDRNLLKLNNLQKMKETAIVNFDSIEVANLRKLLLSILNFLSFRPVTVKRMFMKLTFF